MDKLEKCDLSDVSFRTKREYDATHAYQVKRELDEDECQICGWYYTVLHMHHIKEFGRGGETTLDNCVCLCPNCHKLVHEGLIVIKDRWHYITFLELKGGKYANNSNQPEYKFRKFR